jgi:branched-subunit amino acid aminotransferase/4-amino-4-deoxychorismate lyase
MAEPVCYLNGSLVPLKNAHVGLYDLGLLRGFGIYEGITAFGGEPFRFSDHWKRFERSAKALELTIPVSEQQALEAACAVVAANSPGTRATLRMILTGGEAKDGIEYVPGHETFFILAEPATALPDKFYTKGASMLTEEHQRFLPEFKTIHYITAVLLQKKKREAGVVEILYTSGGNALECTGSNVFIVMGGTLITPDKNILHGITRKVTLELAKGVYPIEERDVTLDELLAADEVFITSSFKDIVPIVSVDGHTIGSGAPGPVTLELMKRFDSHALSHASLH